MRSSKAPACLEKVLRSVLGSSGATVDSFSAKPVPVSVAGSDGGFGYQMAISTSSQGQRLTLTGYEIGTLVGQVELDLSVIASAASDVTLADTTALMSTATARVRAAS
jgi:hypothetical protein